MCTQIGNWFLGDINLWKSEIRFVACALNVHHLRSVEYEVL